jgi:hypothetical protein
MPTPSVAALERSTGRVQSATGGAAGGGAKRMRAWGATELTLDIRQGAPDNPRCHNFAGTIEELSSQDDRSQETEDGSATPRTAAAMTKRAAAAGSRREDPLAQRDW